MQTSVYGKQGILPALPRTIHVESGVKNEYGLPFNDDRRAAVSNDFVLDVYVYGNIF